jgi:hypothetical protein
LLLALFLAFFLMDGLVVFLLRDDALVQQEPQRMVFVPPARQGYVTRSRAKIAAIAPTVCLAVIRPRKTTVFIISPPM